MSEAPDRKPGDGHDHSWAEDVSEVRACCPDYNADLKGKGILCPGDPAASREEVAPVPVGTAADHKGRLITVRRDGDQVIVPAGRYDVTGLTELVNVLFDARGQLWVPEATVPQVPATEARDA